MISAGSPGGGSGAEQRLGRRLLQSMPAEALPARIEAILRAYLAHRRPGESFMPLPGGTARPTSLLLFALVAAAT